MTEPIPLSSFRYARELAKSTPIPGSAALASNQTAFDEAITSTETAQRNGRGLLSAQVLRKLNPETELSRVFEVLTRLVAMMEEATIRIRRSASYLLVPAGTENLAS